MNHHTRERPTGPSVTDALINDVIDTMDETDTFDGTEDFPDGALLALDNAIGCLEDQQHAALTSVKYPYAVAAVTFVRTLLGEPQQLAGAHRERLRGAVADMETMQSIDADTDASAPVEARLVDFLATPWVHDFLGPASLSLSDLAAMENPSFVEMHEHDLSLYATFQLGAMLEAVLDGTKEVLVLPAEPTPTATRLLDHLSVVLNRNPSPMVATVVAMITLHRLANGLPSSAIDRLYKDVERKLRKYFAKRGVHSWVDMVCAVREATCAPEALEMRWRLLTRGALAVEEGTALRARIAAHESASAKSDRYAVRHPPAVSVPLPVVDHAAQARVTALETCVRRLEGELVTARNRSARLQARLEALATEQATLTPVPIEAPVPPVAVVMTPALAPPPPKPVAPVLLGRHVFLYTNQERGNARRAFLDELHALGAVDARVYETRLTALPGPVAFPPGSVVIADTSFLAHHHNRVLRRRAKGSQGCLYCEGRFGVGGLATVLSNVRALQQPLD